MIFVDKIINTIFQVKIFSDHFWLHVVLYYQRITCSTVKWMISGLVLLIIFCVNEFSIMV